MINEIELLEKTFGKTNYEIINENLEIDNYVCTLTFNGIRILQFKGETDFTYIIYIHNLDIPYKINNFDENFFINIKNIYYDKKNNYTNKLKRFSGLLTKLDLSRDDLEKIIVKNKYLEMFYWGSYFEDYPFDDIYENKYSKYQINKMNIYALRQYDNDDDIFEISVLTKYSKSKITFIVYEDALFIELSYNNIENMELEKFYKSTQNLPYDIPIDLYLSLQQFHLLEYNDIFELKPLTINHFKYSSLLLNNLNIVEIENYFNLLNDLELESDELIKYRNDLINLMTLNNIIKNINSKDILDIVNNNSDIKKEIIIEKIREYLVNFLNEYKKTNTNNILSKELLRLEENDSEFLDLHINNLITQFVNN